MERKQNTVQSALTLNPLEMPGGRSPTPTLPILSKSLGSRQSASIGWQPTRVQTRPEGMGSLWPASTCLKRLGAIYNASSKRRVRCPRPVPRNRSTTLRTLHSFRLNHRSLRFNKETQNGPSWFVLPRIRSTDPCVFTRSPIQRKLSETTATLSMRRSRHSVQHQPGSVAVTARTREFLAQIGRRAGAMQ